MMAFYFIDSVLKQSQMVADRRDPRGVMFTGLVRMCGVRLRVGVCTIFIE